MNYKSLHIPTHQSHNIFFKNLIRSVTITTCFALTIPFVEKPYAAENKLEERIKDNNIVQEQNVPNTNTKMLPTLDDFYRKQVKAFAKKRLYTGMPEEKVYQNVTKANMHYLYVAFEELFPKSSHIAEIKSKASGFNILKAPKDHDLFISLEELKTKYHFDGVEKLHYWSNDSHLMTTDEKGKKVFQGHICLGNLQILSGGFSATIQDQTDGLRLLAGTEIIYPNKY